MKRFRVTIHDGIFIISLSALYMILLILAAFGAPIPRVFLFTPLFALIAWFLIKYITLLVMIIWVAIKKED